MQNILQVGEQFQAFLIVMQEFLEGGILMAQEFVRGEDLESPVFEKLAKSHET